MTDKQIITKSQMIMRITELSANLEVKEQECERLKQALAEIKEIAQWHTTSTDSEDIQTDMKQILQLINEVEL